MKHLILGTAGHIDHGKTSLVKALTGTDTDRLPEEKARGITIELGFARLQLPEGPEFAIVDVPGHERFIRTMVAGAAGMDLVMLVIAADEGIMPQTREHLDICRLIGVKKGLVALTKTDLVDQELLDLVTEEVREFLEGSFLDGAAIIPVSARSGAGLDLLRNELSLLATGLEQKRSDAPFRLPVDRVFTRAGFGTVVTGTLLSGSISVGDEVEILPKGVSVRVRGIQAHGTGIETGEAGQRLAVNLHGVEHSLVDRGDVIVPPHRYRTTRRVDVSLSCLASAPRKLRNRSVVRLHACAYEVPAEVMLFDRSELEPGETDYLRLRLARPVLLLPGDPFVLRAYSPAATIGGGTVLDPFPSGSRRRSRETVQLLTTIMEGDDTGILSSLITTSRLTGITLDSIIERTGFSTRMADTAIAPLLANGAVRQILREPRTFISDAAFSELKTLLLEETRNYLELNPLKEGIGREELKSRIPKRSDPRFFAPCVASLEKEGKVVAERELVKLHRKKDQRSPLQSGVLLDIERALQTGGAEPPSCKELALMTGISEKELLEHLALLIREQRAVKVKSDLFYAPAPLASFKEKLLHHFSGKQELTPAEFRDLTGLSRKFMIPVLEYFDAQKITIRVGDRRLLRGR